MKPVAFDYFTPGTVEEAVALLAQHGDDAKILAGGQSLVPMMNFRLVRPKALIDINRVAGLNYVKEEGGKLRVGALTRQRTLEYSPVVRENYGLLYEAVRLVGHPAIRSRGTVGGSVSHADPTAELPTLLVALDGEVQVAGPKGRRSIGCADFFQSYFATSIAADEICVEVTFPMPSAKSGWAFQEFTRRHGDFGIVGVCAVVDGDGNGQCTKARLAIAGVAPIPVRATAAEEFLKGKKLTDAAFQEAGRLVAEQVNPDADLHATAEFRRQLASVMTERTLRQAGERLKSFERR